MIEVHSIISLSKVIQAMLIFSPISGCPRGVMVKAKDSEIVVSKFVLQSRYYVHFRIDTIGKSMNSLILPAMGYIVPLLFFLENDFGII